MSPSRTRDEAENPTLARPASVKHPHIISYPLRTPFLAWISLTSFGDRYIKPLLTLAEPTHGHSSIPWCALDKRMASLTRLKASSTINE